MDIPRPIKLSEIIYCRRFLNNHIQIRVTIRYLENVEEKMSQYFIFL